MCVDVCVVFTCSQLDHIFTHLHHEPKENVWVNLLPSSLYPQLHTLFIGANTLFTPRIQVILRKSQIGGKERMSFFIAQVYCHLEMSKRTEDTVQDDVQIFYEWDPCGFLSGMNLWQWQTTHKKPFLGSWRTPLKSDLEGWALETYRIKSPSKTAEGSLW